VANEKSASDPLELIAASTVINVAGDDNDVFGGVG
jgi:hypothetical protein